MIVVGGATKNRFWLQNKADMVGALFGLPIEAPAVDEATPLGAAMLAGIGVGSVSYTHLDVYKRQAPGR